MFICHDSIQELPGAPQDAPFPTAPSHVACLIEYWLPVAERRQFQVLLSAFKALYFNNWPEYIKVDQYVPGRTLQSSSQIQLEVPTESRTFQDSAAAAFNSLPDSLRNCKDFNIFRTSVKVYLTDLAHERLGPGYK